MLMADGDLTLQFNFCTSGVNNEVSKREQHQPQLRPPKSPKIFHIPEKHKNAKRQKQKSTDSTARATVPPQQEPARKGQKRKADTTEDGRPAKRQAGQQVIASLFKHNPEIPQLHSATVTPVKEEIFSAKNFKDLNLHPFLVSNLEEKLGFTSITAVQQQAIPHILSGRDVMVKSQTGSGKTLAYAVPIVQRLQAMRPQLQRSDGVHAVILVPTRELALQSFDTFQKVLKSFVWVVPGCLMGGEKRKAEKARIRKGINVLVCTPGRLLDHISTTSSLELRRVQYLVIDEADRLLDLGFEKDVAEIVKALDEQCPTRQTVLLSATLSAGVERLAGISLSEPVRVDLSGNQEQVVQGDQDNQPAAQFAVPQQLKQQFVIVPSKLRLVTLAAFILSKCVHCKKSSKLVVFLSTQDSVEFHYDLLLNTICQGSDAEAAFLLYRLHGDMLQKERTKVFQEFTDTKAGVLLCTDVAARGLHLPSTQWIVQYNTPGTPTDYIHRVGRTARAGHGGHALLFLTPDEAKYVSVLNEMKISLEEVSMEDIHKTLLLEAFNLVRDRKERDQRIPRTVEECATALQDVFERYIYSDKRHTEMARKAYISFVRAYATFPSALKHIFHVKHLHLGHVAKSFGLREAPAHIAGKMGQLMSHRQKKRQHMSQENLKASKNKSRHVSEYGSGQMNFKNKKKGKVKKKGKL